MSEEDGRYFKQMHYFGGVGPSKMVAFSANSSYSVLEAKARIKVTGIIPGNTTIDGQELCTVIGVVIRRSSTSYPENEFAGEKFADIKVNYALSEPYDFSIVDSNVAIGETWYYSAFPYSDQGIVNRSNSNRSSATACTYAYLYGYDLDTSNSVPSTRVSYPSDVDNSSYTSAKMNYSTGLFEYGGWPDEAGKKFMPKPCMLKYDGTIDKYLDPNDYSKNIDGTASDYNNTSFGGNAMMQWPKIYTKRTFVDGVYKFRCCDIALDDSYDCWCNYDRNNNVISNFYTSIYFGSSVGGKLRSISGQSNYVNNTRNSEVLLAKANGNDWYTEVLSDWLLIQDMLVMMAKSTDTQACYGNGNCNTSAAIGQGTMNTKGLFWGASNQSSGVKVFGMENWWGNIWRALGGYVNVNGTQKIKITRGTKDGSTASDYNFDGTGYLILSSATPSGTSGGYISSMKNDCKFGRIAITASGSATMHECDAMYFNNSQVDYAIVGGDWGSALLCGAFCLYLGDAASHACTGIGSALSCKPLAA